MVVASAWTDSNPSLSPDGALLAFRSARTGTSEIWVSTANGGTARRLTHSGGAQCGSPDWSPDGRWIAYDARLHSVPHVCSMPAAG
ncbi:MAG TPA: hypothetical protein VFA70_04350, partial [Dehalococcoidia bacterium]|nr:hypothetical protein [Dehalococcoidia bacterium]